MYVNTDVRILEIYTNTHIHIHAHAQDQASEGNCKMAAHMYPTTKTAPVPSSLAPGYFFCYYKILSYLTFKFLDLIFFNIDSAINTSSDFLII